MRFVLIKGIIQKPIYEEVNLPSPTAVKKKRKEVQSYSSTEQKSLMQVLNSKVKIGYSAAILMMETGLRVGECLALSWNDIQWDRRAVSVNKTLIRIANKRIMEVQYEAKSFTSNRTFVGRFLSVSGTLYIQSSFQVSERLGY